VIEMSKIEMFLKTVLDFLRRSLPKSEAGRQMMTGTVAAAVALTIIIAILSIAIGFEGAVLVLLLGGGAVGYQILTKPAPPSKEASANAELESIGILLDIALRNIAALILIVDFRGEYLITRARWVEQKGRIFFLYVITLERPLADLEAAQMLIQKSLDTLCSAQFGNATLRLVALKAISPVELCLVIADDPRRPGPTPPTSNTPPMRDTDFN
jgi:hypothetical protein